ncbi:abortive infection system antitoxin AbiGi family protein [Flavobacterium sp. U410]
MEVNISSNTLFHFTNKKNYLLSILKNGLYVRYSLENYQNLINNKAEIVFPMTCFCDIPLSHVKNHTKTYGRYAIGLTKDWGMRNKVSPVIYAYPNSETTQTLNYVFDNIESFFDINKEELKNIKLSKNTAKIFEHYDNREKELGKKISSVHNNLSNFIRYIKPYEGKFFRDENYLKNKVKFYDEREWRFTPSRDFLLDKKIKDSYSREYFIDPIRRRALNIKLAKHIKLKFEPKDIKFIIVENDIEIPEMINQLDMIFGNKATSNELKLLSTRLISMEQILEDL